MMHQGHITSDTISTLRRGTRGSVTILLLPARAAALSRSDDPCPFAGRPCDDPAHCNSGLRRRGGCPPAGPYSTSCPLRSSYASSPPQRKTEATRPPVTHIMVKKTSNAGIPAIMDGSALGVESGHSFCAWECLQSKPRLIEKRQHLRPFLVLAPPSQGFSVCGPNRPHVSAARNEQ